MKKDSVFPYGTHIYRVPNLPIENLRKDMIILKKLGFNMVKIQESWSHDEPKEGEIDLSDVEELVKEAERLGLLVYFGVTMEQIPAWVWKKYPDCHLVYNTGEPHNDPTQYLLPADGKPGPCWDHPGVQKEGKRFIGILAKRLGRYKNIITWNVWQEIGFWPMLPGKSGFCYCKHTLNKFRKWLQERYDNLEELNDTWRTSFGQWDEVEPPRFHPYVPSWIDWRYFMDDVYLSNAIEWKVKAFKENDSQKRPVFCHVGAPTIGSGKDWRFAERVDYFGSSCYPAWAPFHKWDKGYPEMGEAVSKGNSFKQEMFFISLNFDYVKSVCKGKDLWAAEFQGGPVVTFPNKGRVPSQEDIRRWVLTTLSTGINGLSFWNHRSEIFWSEAYGFGLLDQEGDITERAKEAGNLGKAINRHGQLFKKGKGTKSEVAILINEDLWHFAEATKCRNEIAFNAAQHLTHTIRGIYKVLWESGIWVDFIESHEIEPEEIRSYKAVILPFPLAISDKLMNHLKTYVANGGILISEACPGRYDEYGFARKGELSSISEELFGVKHKDIVVCHESGKSRWTPRERSYGEIVPATRFSGTGSFKGHSVMASLYVETFSLNGAKPILLNGEETTGAVNSYGKGKAYLIGTFLGHAVITHEDKPTCNFLVKLLDGAEVKPERCGKLLRRKCILKNEEAWFLINPTKETISESVDFTDFGKVEDLLEAQIDEDKPLEVLPFSVRVLILQC